MNTQEMMDAFPCSAQALARHTITEEQFSRLAHAAEQSNALFSRNGKHGKEFAIILNRTWVAVSFMDEDGDRHYLKLI